MLMQTYKHLLDKIEILDRLDKPSLKRLSYLLRHKELWPKDFVWRFDKCDQCAMGLARAFWDLNVPHKRPVSRYYDYEKIMTRTFGIDEIVAGELFIHPYCAVQDWCWLGESPFPDITPEMVAGKIDHYLAYREFNADGMAD